MSESLNQIEQADFSALPQTLMAHALDTFGDVQQAGSWLLTPNPALNDQLPLTIAQSAEGTKQVSEILTRIDYGIFS